MGIVIPYTESEIDFIKAHYGKDMKAKEIAAHLGRTERALTKWVGDHREKYGFKDSRLRKPGTSHTYYCNTRKVHVTRIKNADGTFTIDREKKGRNTPLWHQERIEYVKAHYRVDMNAKQLAELYNVTSKQICSLIGSIRRKDSTYLVKKRAKIGDVKEYVTKSGHIRRKIRNEKGWEHIKTGYSKGDRVKVAKINSERLSAAVGEVRTRKTKHGDRQFQKQEDGKWAMIGGGTKRQRVKKEKKPVITSAITRARVPKNDPQRPKNSLDASRNPKEVKIMSDADKIAAGYRYIQLDHKTRVLRHPSKLTEEQKTA